jgi:hypothetical protein
MVKLKYDITIDQSGIIFGDQFLDVVISDYNGMSRNSEGKTISCITFEEFIRKYNIVKFENISINLGKNTYQIFKQIDIAKFNVKNISLSWSNFTTEEMLEVTKRFAQENYLFEVFCSDILAYKETQELIVPKQETPENTLFASTTQQTHPKKYKVEFVVNTNLDILSELIKTFGSVIEYNIKPIFEPLPIIFNNNTCRVQDYTLLVDVNGISLIFDNNPQNREQSVRYNNNKKLSGKEIPEVVSWLETMDSEQVYQMAKFTFTK